jgi:hypothetical protein
VALAVQARRDKTGNLAVKADEDLETDVRLGNAHLGKKTPAVFPSAWFLPVVLPRW